MRTLCLLLGLSVGCKATAPPRPPPGPPGARPRAFARFDQPVYRPNDCVRLAVSLVGDGIAASRAPRAEIAAGLSGQAATIRLTVPLVPDGPGRYALASCLPLNAAASGTAGLAAPPGARIGALVLGVDGAPLGGDEGAAVGAPVETLSPDVELRAMEALGKLRSRAGSRAFAVGWMASIGLLMLVGFGLIPALAIGVASGGAISKMYVRSRKEAHVRAVCEDLGISRRAFAPDQYLLE